MELKILQRYIKYKIQIFILKNKNIQNRIFAEYSYFKNLLYFPTALENFKNLRLNKIITLLLSKIHIE